MTRGYSDATALSRLHLYVVRKARRQSNLCQDLTREVLPRFSPPLFAPWLCYGDYNGRGQTRSDLGAESKRKAAISANLE